MAQKNTTNQKITTRMTKQRMIIMDELRKTRSHPTADEIYSRVRARLPRISLGTVYRNLDIFAAAGDILKLDSVGSTRRFDAFTDPHQHIRCIECGRVGDVEPFQYPDVFRSLCVPEFTITSVRIDFDGVCDACLQARSKAV